MNGRQLEGKIVEIGKVVENLANTVARYTLEVNRLQDAFHLHETNNLYMFKKLASVPTKRELNKLLDTD